MYQQKHCVQRCELLSSAVVKGLGIRSWLSTCDMFSTGSEQNNGLRALQAIN